MGILEKIVTLSKVTGGFECNLENYGAMRDTISNFDYQFKSGTYVLQGECATGGWALSMLLAGKDKVQSGQIIMEDKKLNINDLQMRTCYVGEDAGLKKCCGLLSMSVEEQILYGIKRRLSYDENVESIKSKFGLSDQRFNRKIKYMSGERWKASMAIGYALGKEIYCFPWMNSKTIRKLERCLRICIPSLQLVDAIIIIPTTYANVLDDIISDYSIVNLQ